MESKVTRSCNHCGKLYQARKSRLKHNREIFCSRDCSYKGRFPESIKRQVGCKVCGESFYTYPDRAKIFCSAACQYKARTLGLSQRIVTKPYNITKVWVKAKITCKHCGKDFNTVLSKKDRSKYCSISCYNKHKSVMYSGKGNPAYKNGSSLNHRTHRGSNWEKIRLEIYKRDNFTCQECGVKCIGKKSANKDNSHLIIQCHHKERYSLTKNNSPSNLITLCLKCHLKIEKELRIVSYLETA